MINHAKTHSIKPLPSWTLIMWLSALSLLTCACQRTEDIPVNGVDCHAQSLWSDTRPAINLKHIFCGEINKRGKPVGFHARPGGKNPSTAEVIAIKSGPNAAGVYTAEVAVIAEDGTKKLKFSTLYPDRFSVSQTIAAILNAYKNAAPGQTKWRGPSGQGFDIEGYVLEQGAHQGDINTAYPIYVE